tara:strand:+ start:994 stop:1320 length:327 start_codon:yes stop_codon:yes gene_type:complete
MRTKILKKPRLFKANNIQLKDYGKIKLNPNEMISFVTKSGKEFDFTAKNWGFYVTSSINSRLKKEGFKIAIVKNKTGKIYITAVEKQNKSLFKKYCIDQEQKVLKWLD